MTPALNRSIHLPFPAQPGCLLDDSMLQIRPVAAPAVENREPACNLCGERGTEFVFEAFGCPILKCTRCGLAFTGFTSTQAASQYYRTEYFAAAHCYAESLRAQTAAGSNPDHDECVRQVARHARRTHGRILDIGCAAGALLAAFQNAGWHITGIEPSKEMAHYARQQLGCEVYEETVETSMLPTASFDVVTALHVLEHSSNPSLFVARCRRYLRSHGLLLVEVPDFGSRTARKRGHSWIPLYPDSHRYHFTGETLSNLLARHGFRVIHTQRRGGLGILSRHLSQHTEILQPSPMGNPHRHPDLLGWAFHNRDRLYRIPGLKQFLRYAYWQLCGMNEYLRVYAVRIS
jgi:SAM-dependent methyltransferase